MCFLGRWTGITAILGLFEGIPSVGIRGKAGFRVRLHGRKVHAIVQTQAQSQLNEAVHAYFPASAASLPLPLRLFSLPFPFPLPFPITDLKSQFEHL